VTWPPSCSARRPRWSWPPARTCPPTPPELDDEGVPYGALCMTCGHTNGEHSAGGRCLFPTGDLRTQAEHDNACDCPALVLSPAMQVNHQARRARRGRLDPRVRGV
jgi:hypothetical protein